MNKITFNTQLIKLCIVLLLFVTNSNTWAQITDGGSPVKSFTISEINKSRIPVIQVPAIDLEKVQAEDEIADAEGMKAPRFGVLVPMQIGFSDGVWNELPNGDRIWRLQIKADKAKAVNLYYDDFFMPKGATMHVYSPDKGQVLGGFASHNNSEHNMFVTSLIYGDELVVEYFEPFMVRNQGRISVSDVNHAYRMIDNPYDYELRDFGNSDAACQVNVNCSPEGDGKEGPRDASARILGRVGNSGFWCSGTVMNNVRQDCTPFFLTALHCANDGTGSITSQTDFNQWVFYFNYQASGCTNPGSGASLDDETVTGANIQIADLTLSDSIEFSIVQSSGGGAAAAWGAITGTLSSQTDLQAALDAKQGDITLTTVGTAGAATLVGDTLNIPEYANTTDHSALSNLDYASAGHTGFEPAKGVDDNYVTDANLVVINNTSGTNTGDQDLSGLQGDITLTTTGTSGAATFIADTLNIPNYASSGGATSTVTADTGTAISLANNVGNFCNMASANTNTTFTVTGAVAGGFARVLINTATQPTVTGGTLENGADWIASSNMYLDVYYDGANTKYYFISIASVSETEDRLEENATTTGTYNLDYALYECWNLTLTGATTLTESNLPTSGTNSKVILLNVTGDFALTYPANWSTNIIGTYDGTVTNTIAIWYVKSAIYKVQISQPD